MASIQPSKTRLVAVRTVSLLLAVSPAIVPIGQMSR